MDQVHVEAEGKEPWSEERLEGSRPRVDEGIECQATGCLFQHVKRSLEIFPSANL